MKYIKINITTTQIEVKDNYGDIIYSDFEQKTANMKPFCFAILPVLANYSINV
jgi:hypothetical protein